MLSSHLHAGWILNLAAVWLSKTDRLVCILLPIIWTQSINIKIYDYYFSEQTVCHSLSAHNFCLVSIIQEEKTKSTIFYMLCLLRKNYTMVIMSPLILKICRWLLKLGLLTKKILCKKNIMWALIKGLKKIPKYQESPIFASILLMCICACQVEPKR